MKSELAKITALEPDVILRCGSGILHGDILKAAKYGVISFHHGDNRINRGGPAGFWEVMHRISTTGFIIQRLTETLDGGEVFVRGQFLTQRYFFWNQVSILVQSNHYLQVFLADLAKTRKLPPVLSSYPYFKPLYRTPNLYQQLCYSLKTAGHLCHWFLNSSVRKKTRRWQVAFYKGNWQNLVMHRAHRMENPSGHFLADPFVIKHADKNFCFVEDYQRKQRKGTIAVYELQNKTAKRLGTAIEEPFHLSFPYLFRYQGKIYMCPESFANNDIRIYEAVKFPLKWRFKTVIMENIQAADSLIFAKDRKWWLITTVNYAGQGFQNQNLCVFYADNPLSRNWQPLPQNPIFIDAAKARNGGLVKSGNTFYRVAQKPGFCSYGEGFTLQKIVTLTAQHYHEQEAAVIAADFWPRIIGTHHLHSNDEYAVFDFAQNQTWR